VKHLVLQPILHSLTPHKISDTDYPVRFTWDAAKSEGNARKHGVTFPEARSVFDDERALVDRQSHAGEYRMQIVGYSTAARLLFVGSPR
jgi:uncharacterized DUF497 family protein